ncbi:hypothetical protein C2W62_50915 [Candidatus Entotheonella serta]|nr:hypothetical protein C2W62_50915 [Candidatus Entotheonella serta]
MTEMKEAENAYGARAAVERTFLVGGPMLCYLVQVYRCLQAHMRCSHMAKTTRSDPMTTSLLMAIDGASVDEVLSKQQAILSRSISRTIGQWQWGDECRGRVPEANLSTGPAKSVSPCRLHDAVNHGGRIDPLQPGTVF